MCKHPFNNIAYYYVVVDTGLNLLEPSIYFQKVSRRYKCIVMDVEISYVCPVVPIHDTGHFLF